MIPVQVELTGFMILLGAADKLSLTVVISTRHRKDIEAHTQHYPWLSSMMEAGRLLFADHVVELMELALEGELRKCIDRDGCQSSVSMCSPYMMRSLFR